MKVEHFVEITATEKHQVTAYRFYGQGVWKVKDGAAWRAINGIHIPAAVLEVAAAQCKPEPVRHPALMTERDIAQLCGGRRTSQSSGEENNCEQDEGA